MVEVNFVHNGENVDFEVSVSHQRVEVATSFDCHLGLDAFVVHDTDFVTVKMEHAQEMPERRGKPSGFTEEHADFALGKHEGAEMVNLTVDFRHIFLGELHDAAILAVAALVCPLCCVVAVLGEVQVVHVELVQVCLKQTFYTPMV